MIDNLCQQFANIIGGEVESTKNNVCMVSKPRSNLNISIGGRPTKSGLVIGGMFSYESMDDGGNTLNLGEIVVLQSEANSFIASLINSGITLGAFHNHWLYDNPRVMYVHFESVEPPLSFARKVAIALSVLNE